MSNKERKQRLAEIRHALKLTKPLAGYLGNQYLYWKEEYECTRRCPVKHPRRGL